MADAANDMEDGAEVDRTHAEIKKLVPRAPNKKKFEEDLEEINKQIKAKEVNLKSLNARPEDGVHQSLRAIRADKDAALDKRRKVDSNLRAINQEITKQNAALTKVQTNLQYKNEDKINEAIRQLEYQLKSNNFRLSEEKRIVAEIDSLKRSKKALSQYLELKKIIDDKRSQQRRMREERDHYFKLVTKLKQKEEAVRGSAQENKSKAEAIKKEVDELYEHKRELVSEFKLVEKDWHAYRDEQRRRQREELLRKKEEERRLQEEEYEKDLAEYEASHEPYEDERQLCQALMAYLQPLRPSGAEAVLESPDASQDASGSDLVAPAEGMYVLRKKSSEDDGWSGARAGPKSRKNRRDRRKTLNRPITHSAQIFAQFSQLDLTAPSNASEVPKALQELEAKLSFFGEQGSLTVSQPPQIAEPTCEWEGSARAPSFTESALSESIPTTPEVQLDDSQPPRFVTHRRKLSLDSGACCEEPNSSDEQPAEEPVAAAALSCDSSETCSEHSSSSHSVIHNTCSELRLQAEPRVEGSPFCPPPSTPAASDSIPIKTEAS